jgi:hypothetical protein
MTFGPWAPGIADAERLARLRAMRGLALVLTRGETAFIDALTRAERDPTALATAAELLERVPARQRRNLLCTYAVLAKQK